MTAGFPPSRPNTAPAPFSARERPKTVPERCPVGSSPEAK